MGYLNYSVLFIALVFLSTTSRAQNLSVDLGITNAVGVALEGQGLVQCRGATGQTIVAANANVSLSCGRGVAVVASGASNSQGRFNLTVNANVGGIVNSLLGGGCEVGVGVPIVNCTLLPVSGIIRATLLPININLLGGLLTANFTAVGFQV